MRWGGIFDIDKKLIEISNEEEKTFDPNFWNNPKEAELVVRDLRSKKKWLEDYQKGVNLAEELQMVYEFYKEGDATEEEVDTIFEQTNALIENLEFKNTNQLLILAGLILKT